MFYVNERWLGGLLTNFATIQRSLGRLRDLEAMATDGRYDTLSKKEIARNEKEKRKLQKNLEGIRGMSRLPDAVFVVDTKKEKIAVDEARKLKIPVIGIVDTNCDPDEVDFVIPGNDDALRAIRLFASRIADAVIVGPRHPRIGRRPTTRAKATDGDDDAPRGRAAAPAAPRTGDRHRRRSRRRQRASLSAGLSHGPAFLCTGCTSGRRRCSVRGRPASASRWRIDMADHRSTSEEAPRPDRRGHDGVQGRADRGRTATSRRRSTILRKRGLAQRRQEGRPRRPAKG